jgi:acylpyruvate hydrolase
MRLVTYNAGQGPRAGVLIDGEIAPAGASVRELLAGPEITYGEERLARSEVHLLPPVPDPEKIICLGLNYRDHANEAGQDLPVAPMWFAKFANSLIGDGDPIVLPSAHAGFVDYEAELAVVIGSGGAIAAAMPFNDVSARDLQLQNPLWTSGKAIDTFAPCGPALVTIFGVAETVAWLSRTMTLKPGDIIATGTPAGVGGFRGQFLRDGDVVEVEVEELGTLSSPVRAS